MSQEPHSHDEAGPIKTPKQLIVTIVLAFVIPILLIVLLVKFVTTGKKESTGSNQMTMEAINERIKPIGYSEVNAVTSLPGAASGEDVYKNQCVACHAAGSLGAPKFADTAAWGPRLEQGLDALWNAAMKGKNAMPAQGSGEYTPDEIKRAVVYLANSGGGKFEAPAIEAAPAASAP